VPPLFSPNSIKSLEKQLQHGKQEFVIQVEHLISQTWRRKGSCSKNSVTFIHYSKGLAYKGYLGVQFKKPAIKTTFDGYECFYPSTISAHQLCQFSSYSLCLWSYSANGKTTAQFPAHKHGVLSPLSWFKLVSNSIPKGWHGNIIRDFLERWEVIHIHNDMVTSAFLDLRWGKTWEDVDLYASSEI
jgi:hypothetical protein